MPWDPSSAGWWASLARRPWRWTLVSWRRIAVKPGARHGALHYDISLTNRRITDHPTTIPIVGHRPWWQQQPIQEWALVSLAHCGTFWWGDPCPQHSPWRWRWSRRLPFHCWACCPILSLRACCSPHHRLLPTQATAAGGGHGGKSPARLLSPGRQHPRPPAAAWETLSMGQRRLLQDLPHALDNIFCLSSRRLSPACMVWHSTRGNGGSRDTVTGHHTLERSLALYQWCQQQFLGQARAVIWANLRCHRLKVVGLIPMQWWCGAAQVADYYAEDEDDDNGKLSTLIARHHLAFGEEEEDGAWRELESQAMAILPKTVTKGTDIVMGPNRWWLCQLEVWHKATSSLTWPCASVVPSHCNVHRTVCFLALASLPQCSGMPTPARNWWGTGVTGPSSAMLNCSLDDNDSKDMKEEDNGQAVRGAVGKHEGGRLGGAGNAGEVSEDGGQ